MDYVPHNCRKSVDGPSIYRAYNRIETAKWALHGFAIILPKSYGTSSALAADNRWVAESSRDVHDETARLAC